MRQSVKSRAKWCIFTPAPLQKQKKWLNQGGIHVHCELSELCTERSHLVQTRQIFAPSCAVCTVRLQIKRQGQVETVFCWWCLFLCLLLVLVVVALVVVAVVFLASWNQLHKDFGWLTWSKSDNKGNLILSSCNCYFQTLHFHIGFVLTLSCQKASIVLAKKRFLSSQRWTYGLLWKKRCTSARLVFLDSLQTESWICAHSTVGLCLI